MPISAEDIKDLATFLKNMRSQGNRVTLFLGHRTGLLYRGNLHREIKNYTKDITDGFKNMLNTIRHNTSIAKELDKWVQDIESFPNLPNSDSFKKCYAFLSKYFNENAVHTILDNALKSTSFREEDKQVAMLIKAGFFDTVLTTNFDALLEEACNSLGMKTPDDYRLFIYGSEDNDSKSLEQDSGSYGQIVKIFGDINSRKEKTVGNEFNLEANPSIRMFLESALAKDIVVLGYDPTWDKPIEQAFQKTDRILWYVNENKPASHTHLAEVLKESHNRYIGGPGLNYEFFLQRLSNFIGENATWKPEIRTSSPLAPSQKPKRDKIFISYSHADEQYLQRLQTNLKQLQHVDVKALNFEYGEVWDDTKIQPGNPWKEKIKEALERTKVAVLLISPDFFASEFIHKEELPVLLEAAKTEEVIIISVLLSLSLFKKTELSKYQCINNEKEFLNNKNTDQDKIWNKLIERIFFEADLQQ